MKIVYRSDDPEVRKALDERAKRVVALHGGIAEMCRAGASPATDTDEVHIRINRSGLSEHEKRLIAKRAKKMGLPEESGYDPTVPGCQVYESRAQVDAAIANARDKANRRAGRPVHRLHPRNVQKIKRRMVAEDPSLLKQDQKELEQEIINRHSPPE